MLLRQACGTRRDGGQPKTQVADTGAWGTRGLASTGTHLPGHGCLERNDLAFRAYSRLQMCGKRVLCDPKVARFPERNFMNRKLGFVLVAFMAVPVALLGQEKPAAAPAPAAQAAPPVNPITASEKGFYSFVSNAAVGAAQKMPEENYSFRPTPEVRTFGQIVGHVADASYMFCSNATGEANPSTSSIEKTKTSKADLVAALQGAVAYCNKAFDGMTDAKGSEMVKLFNFNLAKLTVFSINTAHTDEHYGNMVTYLRLKGIVPPTSEAQPPPAPAKK